MQFWQGRLAEPVAKLKVQPQAIVIFVRINIGQGERRAPALVVRVAWTRAIHATAAGQVSS